MDKVNWASVLIEYKSIIGSLVSVIVGALLTLFLKSFGTIKNYVKLFEYHFSKQDEYCNIINTEIYDAEMLSINFIIEILNTSDVQKSIRELRVQLFDCKNTLISENIPADNKTQKVSAGRLTYKKLSFVNLPPHELMELELATGLSGEAIKNLSGGKIVFTYKTLKNRKKKLLIGIIK